MFSRVRYKLRYSSALEDVREVDCDYRERMQSLVMLPGCDLRNPGPEK